MCLFYCNVTFAQQDVTATIAQSGDSKNTTSKGSPEVITGTLIRISPKLSDLNPVLLNPNQVRVGKEDEQQVQRRDGFNKKYKQRRISHYPKKV